MTGRVRWDSTDRSWRIEVGKHGSTWHRLLYLRFASAEAAEHHLEWRGCW